MFIQADGLFEEGGRFKVAAGKTLLARVVQRHQRQLFCQSLSACRWQEIHFLQFADIRLAAAEGRHAAAAHDLTVLLDDPVGMTRLAVELEKRVQIRVGNRVALVSRQSIFGRNGANNGGDSRVILLSDPAHRRRDGGNHAHSITHDKN